MASNRDDSTLFENTIRAFEAEIANVGAHLTVDAAVRQRYGNRIKELADDLRAQATRGTVSWTEAASQAQANRNVIMNVIRGRSTPVGRAMAEALKREGKTLNEIVARKTMQMFGSGTSFTRLTPGQQNSVYAAIVESAGRANAEVTIAMRRLSRIGRGLLFLSLGLSVYTILTADDKLGAAKREVVITGVGIGGGVAGGALAGLACGPGAPVCVAVGAFVGGAMAAFGVDSFW